MRRLALLRSLRSVVIFGIPLLVLSLIANASFAPADQRVVVNFLISLVLVLSIQTFSGNSGIVTFGHIAFMGVGAYVAALATIPPARSRARRPSRSPAGRAARSASRRAGWWPARRRTPRRP